MRIVATVISIGVIIFFTCISGCITTTTMDQNYTLVTDNSNIYNVKHIIVPEPGIYHIHLQTLSRGSRANLVLSSYDHYETKVDKFGVIESKWTIIKRFDALNYIFGSKVPRNLDNWNCLSNDNQNCDQNITLSDGRNFDISIGGNGEYKFSIERLK